VSRIPLVDLSLQHLEVADEIQEGLARVFAKSDFILGQDVARFEESFARFVQVGHCVGVANGTDALELALRAAGVGPGSEVIVPANSFVASALAVVRAGATPVFVDSDPEYHLIDVQQVEAALSARTHAIVPVHLYGQIAPMAELADLASANGVALIEDAAQAQGARQGGRSAGTFGLAAGTSFYPSKNLGAYGDAGAVLTDDDEIARKVRGLRNYGGTRRYEHSSLGVNSRLDTVQAVVLSAKLRRLEKWNAQRRQAADRYAELLAGVAGVRAPSTRPGNEHVWHLYVIRVPDRDSALEKLNAAGIGAGIHYPVPIHLCPAFAELGYGPGSFPSAEKAASEILSLPLFPGITAAQQERVVRELARC